MKLECADVAVFTFAMWQIRKIMLTYVYFSRSDDHKFIFNFVNIFLWAKAIEVNSLAVLSKWGYYSTK